MRFYHRVILQFSADFSYFLQISQLNLYIYVKPHFCACVSAIICWLFCCTLYVVAKPCSQAFWVSCNSRNISKQSDIWCISVAFSHVYNHVSIACVLFDLCTDILEDHIWLLTSWQRKWQICDMCAVLEDITDLGGNHTSIFSAFDPPGKPNTHRFNSLTPPWMLMCLAMCLVEKSSPLWN